jgi:ferrochelatase
MGSTREHAFEHGQPACAGVLLINLGTPDEPSTPALRRYLAEFLWDPRVVEIPRPLWWLILHGIILRTRPAQSAEKYRSVWTADGSPLLAISRRQTRSIQNRVQEHFQGPVQVALGMRYGNPSIGAALEQLRNTGITRLLVLPLYPQYSASTTATAFDKLADTLKTWRWLPELRMITHYHDDPDYIAAVAQSIQSARQQQQLKAEKLLFSFHGLPKRNLLLGDPYHCECHKTARLVSERLHLDEGSWSVAFQSRFGKAEWLKPYTSEQLKQWAESGIKSVDVVCPGFSADCLETLEEIEQENREVFVSAGGEHYRYIPALNDSANHINALVRIIERHTGGWPEFTRFGEPADVSAGEPEHSRQRALAIGAER